ncbi:MAG: NAD-dependent epimerase/dehydratase family protein [Pseudomonadota bacterium]
METQPPGGRGQTALVTGAAGFIGYHLCARLLSEGWQVIGLDSMSDYYDVSLKERRRGMLLQNAGFRFEHGAVETPGLLDRLFEETAPSLVVHLAAQAGVRYSIEAPETYVEANLIGTFRLLEAMRAHPPRHAFLASTSSVYGANAKMPYAEDDKADSQMSFYAATKKANEAMAHSYAHLFGVPITMFRFFTVYGPWGRPDMALFKFTKAILEGQAIDVYNHGDMQRDFTYIDDLVESIVRLVPCAPSPEARQTGDSLSEVAPFRILNIGNAQPVRLLEFIEAIESATGREAHKNMMEMQPGDVAATWATTDLLQALTGYRPSTPVTDGVAKFVEWYRGYYQV